MSITNILLIIIIIIILAYVLICNIIEKIINISENNLKFYVINMEKNKDRLKNIMQKAKKQKINLEKIEAVNGKTFDIEYIKNWPCLSSDSHYGYKGLQLSNLKIFKKVKEIKKKPEWIVIFEDDAEIPNDFLKIINKSILNYPKVKVINFDHRQSCKQNEYAGCCMSCVMYKYEIIEMLIKYLDYETNDFMKNYKKLYNQDCLWDWYIFNLLEKFKIPMVCVPVVKSGNFVSTLSV